jgi:hypothetical protein
MNLPAGKRDIRRGNARIGLIRNSIAVAAGEIKRPPHPGSRLIVRIGCALRRWREIRGGKLRFWAQSAVRAAWRIAISIGPN